MDLGTCYYKIELNITIFLQRESEGLNMSISLKLKFGINLEDYQYSKLALHHGPLFHKWLPNGEKDSIRLESGDTNVDIKIWFEQRGYMDNGLIEFSYDRREINPEIISTQAILDAGPLMGMLEIRGISEEEVIPLRKNMIGDYRYIALGKIIVNNWIYPSVFRFLNILRTNYGQYWIREIKEWDSRKESLGSYCRMLNLNWSLDEDTNWKTFQPEKSVLKLEIVLNKDFSEYLTEKDWIDLSKIVQEKYDPPLSVFQLMRAHQLSDEGNLKHAFIEGVSALEIALHELIHYVRK
jgi:hypothetical protein